MMKLDDMNSDPSKVLNYDDLDKAQKPFTKNDIDTINKNQKGICLEDSDNDFTSSNDITATTNNSNSTNGIAPSSSQPTPKINKLPTDGIDDDDTTQITSSEFQRYKESSSQQTFQSKSNSDSENISDNNTFYKNRPISSSLSSSQNKLPSKCVICNISFSSLSQKEREIHTNGCLEAINASDKITSSTCSICNKDLTKLTKNKREEHSIKCKKSSESLSSSENSVCVVCKKSLLKFQTHNRIKHIKSCAKKSNVSTKDLLDLDHHKQDLITPIVIDDDDDNTNNKISNAYVPSKPSARKKKTSLVENQGSLTSNFFHKSDPLTTKTKPKKPTSKSTTNSKKSNILEEDNDDSDPGPVQKQGFESDEENGDDDDDIKMAIAMSLTTNQDDNINNQSINNSSQISSTPMDLAGFKFKPPDINNTSNIRNIADILFPITTTTHHNTNKSQSPPPISPHPQINTTKIDDKSVDIFQSTPKFSTSRLTNKYPSTNFWDVSRFRDENNKDLLFVGSQQKEKEKETELKVPPPPPPQQQSSPPPQQSIQPPQQQLPPQTQQPIQSLPHPPQQSIQPIPPQQQLPPQPQQQPIQPLPPQPQPIQPTPEKAQGKGEEIVNSNGGGGGACGIVIQNSDNKNISEFFLKIASVTSEFNDKMIMEKERIVKQIKDLETEFYTNMGKLMIQRELKYDKVKRYYHSSISSNGMIIYSPNVSDQISNIMNIGDISIQFPQSFNNLSKASPTQNNKKIKGKRKSFIDGNHERNDHDDDPSNSNDELDQEPILKDDRVNRSLNTNKSHSSSSSTTTTTERLNKKSKFTDQRDKYNNESSVQYNNKSKGNQNGEIEKEIEKHKHTTSLIANSTSVSPPNRKSTTTTTTEREYSDFSFDFNDESFLNGGATTIINNYSDNEEDYNVNYHYNNNSSETNSTSNTNTTKGMEIGDNGKGTSAVEQHSRSFDNITFLPSSPGNNSNSIDNDELSSSSFTKSDLSNILPASRDKDIPLQINTFLGTSSATTISSKSIPPPTAQSSKVVPSTTNNTSKSFLAQGLKLPAFKQQPKSTVSPPLTNNHNNSNNRSTSTTTASIMPDYQSMTLAELKQKASSIGIKTTGKEVNKQFYINRLTDVWQYQNKRKQQQ